MGIEWISLLGMLSSDTMCGTAGIDCERIPTVYIRFLATFAAVFYR